MSAAASGGENVANVVYVQLIILVCTPFKICVVFYWIFVTQSPWHHSLVLPTERPAIVYSLGCYYTYTLPQRVVLRAPDASQRRPRAAPGMVISLGQQGGPSVRNFHPIEHRFNEKWIGILRRVSSPRAAPAPRSRRIRAPARAAADSVAV